MGSKDSISPSADQTGGPDQRIGDLFVGSTAVLMGLIVLFVLIPKTIGPLGSGATFLAMFGAGGLVLFGSILVLSSLRRVSATWASAHVNQSRAGRVQATGLVLITLAYAWGLDWIGFLPASYVALAALLVLLGTRSVLGVLVLPAVIVLAIYLGIDVALGASLPEGRFDWPFLSFLGHSVTEFALV